jgi:hypothetical protein
MPVPKRLRSFERQPNSKTLALGFNSIARLGPFNHTHHESRCDLRFSAPDHRNCMAKGCEER